MTKMKKQILFDAANFYAQGKSLNQTIEYLAKKYQYAMHRNTLRYHLKRLGLNLRSSKEGVALRLRKKVNATDIVDYYEKTKSIRAVSREHELSRNTVKRVLSENRVQLLDKEEAT